MTNKGIAALTIAIITRQHIVWIGLRKIFEHGESHRFVVLPHRLIVSDALLPENRPDVFILDMETERDTIGVISQIRKATPKSKIMLLSGFEDKERTREAFEYGVEGVILKIQPPEVVLAAIDALYCPARHLGHVERDGAGVVKRSESLVTKADTDTHPSVWPDALTQREREVIRLVGQGLSNKDIAYQLSISDSTVRHHLTNIFDKVGVPNRQKLLLHAHQVRSTPD
ncbi:MAG TPA: response regulator transcription factor [Nitrospira sp.]